VKYATSTFLALLFLTLFGCEISCKDLPVRYEVLVLPVRVDPEPTATPSKSACEYQVDRLKSEIESLEERLSYTTCSCGIEFD